MAEFRHRAALTNGRQHMLQELTLWNVVVDIIRGHQGDACPISHVSHAAQHLSIVGTVMEFGQRIAAIGESIAIGGEALLFSLSPAEDSSMQRPVSSGGEGRGEGSTFRLQQNARQ